MGKKNEQIHQVLAVVILLVSLCSAAFAYAVVMRLQNAVHYLPPIHGGLSNYEICQFDACVGNITVELLVEKMGAVLIVDASVFGVLSNTKIRAGVSINAFFNSLGQFSGGELRVASKGLDLRVTSEGIIPIKVKVKLEMPQYSREFKDLQVDGPIVMVPRPNNDYQIILPGVRYKSLIEKHMEGLVKSLGFKIIGPIESDQFCQPDKYNGIDLSVLLKSSQRLREKLNSFLSVNSTE